LSTGSASEFDLTSDGSTSFLYDGTTAYVQSGNPLTLQTLNSNPITLITNVSGTPQTWTFGADGSLTSPGGALIFTNVGSDPLLTLTADLANGGGIVIKNGESAEIDFVDSTSTYEVALQAPSGRDFKVVARDVILAANVDNGDATWTFAASGTLTTPGAVGINGAPNASAALDITSTTQGFLLPRMTEVQRDAIASPAYGLMVYTTDHSDIDYWAQDNSWKTLFRSGNLDVNGVDASPMTVSVLDPTYWSGTPSTLGEALNRMAAAIFTLQGTTPIA